MSKHYKFRGAVLGFAICCLSLGMNPNHAAAATPATSNKTKVTAPVTINLKDYFDNRISASEIKAAGFIEPVVVPPSATKFLAPVYYFRVKDVPAKNTGDAWGDAKSLVSVLVRPVANKKWVYNNGDIQLRDLGGRFEARVSSPEHYIVVAGPNKDKVVTLLHNLKVLY